MSTTGPTTQPSCDIAHASDSTPDPMTAVIMCALAVSTVPATTVKLIFSLFKKIHKYAVSPTDNWTR